MQDLLLIWGPKGNEWRQWAPLLPNQNTVSHHSFEVFENGGVIPAKNTVLVWVIERGTNPAFPANLPQHIPIMVLAEEFLPEWEEDCAQMPNPLVWVAAREAHALMAGLATIRRKMRRRKEMRTDRGWESLFLRQENEWIRIWYKDILWMKSDRVYQEIMTVDGRKWVLRQSLSKTIAQLPRPFMRIHRSYIININFLEAIGQNEVTVKGHRLPIARRTRDELLAELGV